MLLGMGHGQWLGGEESVLVPAWVSLATVDFSRNRIKQVDESVVCSFVL